MCGGTKLVNRRLSAHTLTIYYMVSAHAHLQLWNKSLCCQHLLQVSKDLWAIEH